MSCKSLLGLVSRGTALTGLPGSNPALHYRHQTIDDIGRKGIKATKFPQTLPGPFAFALPPQNPLLDRCLDRCSNTNSGARVNKLATGIFSLRPSSSSREPSPIEMAAQVSSTETSLPKPQNENAERVQELLKQVDQLENSDEQKKLSKSLTELQEHLEYKEPKPLSPDQMQDLDTVIEDSKKKTFSSGLADELQQETSQLLEVDDDSKTAEFVSKTHHITANKNPIYEFLLLFENYQEHVDTLNSKDLKEGEGHFESLKRVNKIADEIKAFFAKHEDAEGIDLSDSTLKEALDTCRELNLIDGDQTVFTKKEANILEQRCKSEADLLPQKANLVFQRMNNRFKTLDQVTQIVSKALQVTIDFLKHITDRMLR